MSYDDGRYLFRPQTLGFTWTFVCSVCGKVKPIAGRKSRKKKYVCAGCAKGEV